MKVVFGAISGTGPWYYLKSFEPGLAPTCI